MNDYTMELLVVGRVKTGGVVSRDKLFGICAHGIEADDHIATHHIGVTIIEGNDIRVVVVSEELTVDVQYALVVHKTVAHRAYTLAVKARHSFYPLAYSPAVHFRQGNAFCLKRYHTLVTLCL